MNIARQRINQWVSNNNANEDLFLNNLNLRELPELPNNLQELDCSNNQLTSLPVLPNTLKYLDCSDNSLTILPILPDTLEDLVCRNNNLTNFPNLPTNLHVLYIDDIIIFTNAQLRQLYENEVEVIVRDREIDLYYILTNNPPQQNNPQQNNNIQDYKITTEFINEVKNNEINSNRCYEILKNWQNSRNIEMPLDLNDLDLFEFPILPDTVKNLNIKNNKFQYIPKLPSNLITLDITNNRFLQILPELPSSLTQILLQNDCIKLTQQQYDFINTINNNINVSELKIITQEEYNKILKRSIIYNIKLRIVDWIIKDDENEVLTLSKLNLNNIDDINEYFVNYYDLYVTDLDISHNNLITLPHNLADIFPNLVSLDCRNNKLKYLPKLPTLYSLYCDINDLQILPELSQEIEVITFDSKIKLTQQQYDLIINTEYNIVGDNNNIDIQTIQIISQEEYDNRLTTLSQSPENILEYKNNYYNNNNELNCGNDTTFLGDEVDNIDKIFLFLNEDTGKYNIYCYTTDELINTLLKAEKLYKWNKEIEHNWAGKPDLNKRVLKEPYTNCYINFYNLNKIIIYNCFLLKPTKKYRLGSGEVNIVSRMHGRDIDIAMVYDVYPINYELIKNKVKISKDDIINFVPKLQDIDNRYNENLIITNLDEKTNNIIPDINSLNKNMNYQISNNKIQIINTKLYRRDILKDKKQYPNIINATEFIRN